MAKKPSSAPSSPAEPQATAPESPPTEGAAKGSPPVWKKRLYSNGSFIECAVFRNQVDQGESSFTTYSASVQRSYKDGEGQWKQSHSMRRDDLLVASHVLQRAYAWISEQEQ